MLSLTLLSQHCLFFSLHVGTPEGQACKFTALYQQHSTPYGRILIIFVVEGRNKGRKEGRNEGRKEGRPTKDFI